MNLKYMKSSKKKTFGIKMNYEITGYLDMNMKLLKLKSFSKDPLNITSLILIYEEWRKDMEIYEFRNPQRIEIDEMKP